jgi:hypothetical protein
MQMEKVWKARGSGSGGAGWRERERRRRGERAGREGEGGEGGITLLELRPPSSQRVYADKQNKLSQAPRKKRW